nr:Vps23 core domain [Moritella viscosa]SHO18833.1 Vps23 core domain [Moritella viscosa]
MIEWVKTLVDREKIDIEKYLKYFKKQEILNIFLTELDEMVFL